MRGEDVNFIIGLLKRIVFGVLAGIVSSVVAVFVIWIGTILYIINPDKHPLSHVKNPMRYSRKGKVVNLNDFRTDKAGREF